MRVVIKQRSRATVRLKAISYSPATKATEEQATAGTDNVRYMTPYLTAQQANGRLASQAEAEAGSDNTKTMTPLRTKESIDLNAEGANFTQAGADVVVRPIRDKLRDWLSAADFGTSTAALNAAAVEAKSSGKKLIIPKADYTLTSTFGVGSLASDIEVICEPGARFIADAAFPVGDMVQFTGGAGKRVIWRGGTFDGSLMPNSAPGQSNDVMSFNLSGAGLLLVEDVDIDVGADFTTAGSDSGIFAGWATRMIFNRIKVKGAPDAAIYLSGGSTGDGSTEITEEVSFDDLSFDACMNGLIIKRRFKRVNGGRVYVTDSVNGVTLGGEALMGDATTILQAENISVESIIAKRTGIAAILRFAENARIGSVVMRDMGCKIGSYTDSVATAVSLQGAQRCHVGSIIADGENSDIAGLTSIAVRANSRTINGETRHSTDNAIGPIISRNINRSVQEDDANQDRNVYETGPEVSVGEASSVRGAASMLHRLQFGSSVILAQSSVAASVTGTTTETTLATITIPGGTMRPNGRLIITCVWSYSSAGGTKTARVRFGGVSMSAIGGLASSGTLRQQTEISNRNAANSQMAMASVAGGFGTSASAIITAAVDTTVSRDIVLQGTLTNAGDTVTLESYRVELIYAP